MDLSTTVAVVAAFFIFFQIKSFVLPLNNYKVVIY